MSLVRFIGDSITSGIAHQEIQLSREKETMRFYHHNMDSQVNKTLPEYEPNVESCCKESLLLEKTREIAGVRRELELISKLLTDHENGAIEDQNSGGLVSASTVWDPNGERIGTVMSKPENLEDLRILSREQLIKHFNSEMNRLKREHDCTIQEMTEEYFSIKRRCFNLEEHPSFSSLKNDKEFDVLRKKIPDIISKLDKVLLEEEKSVFGGTNFNSQLDSLLLENRQLKDSLLEAGEQISQLSQVEANHRNLIRKLELDVEDSHIEASIYEDVFGFLVGEFVKEIQCTREETDLEHQTMRESSESKIDLEDSCIEYYMAEECCTVIYKKAWKKANKKLGELSMNVTEKERALRTEMVEKERLKEENHWLERLVKEKENLLQIAKNDLAAKKEKLEIVFKQINNLQFQIDQQDVEIQGKNKQLRVVSDCALDKTESYEIEISELIHKLVLVRKNMEINENEKAKLEWKLSSSEAEQKSLKNQFVQMALSLANWSQCFHILECLVAEEMKKRTSRLESMQSQLNDLLDEVDELKARESMYKQQMEKKICDLHKAETEVDLLGDEIETFLDLLEKIYLGLDHYSPILKHYPGIIEILKLVRRELKGESNRLSVFKRELI